MSSDNNTIDKNEALYDSKDSDDNSSDLPLRSGEKFFFDLNIFDEEEAEEELDEAEDLPPPPPMFSEEELKQAKQESFKSGKTEGAEQAKQSREQFAAGFLQKIEEHCTRLYENEVNRKKVFEHEAVALSLAVFEKLFPVYLERHGFEELKASIDDILSAQTGAQKISVRVHPDYLDPMRDYLETINIQGHEAVFDCVGDDSLSTGECRIQWKHGGAARNLHSLAESIKSKIVGLVEDKYIQQNPTPVSENGNKKNSDISYDVDTLVDTDTNLDQNQISSEIEDQGDKEVDE